MSVVITGADELYMHLRQAREGAKGVRLTQVVRDIGQLIVESAKQKVAVDTNALKDSIEIAVEHEGDTQVSIGVVAGNDEVRYAVYQEYGTWKMPAHPYLRPAFDEIKGSAEAVMGAKFWNSITRRS